MKEKLLIDIGGTLSLKYYAHSIQQVPSSAFITIYDDGGAEKVAEVAATIAADGTMSYIVTAAISNDVYSNWKAVWKFIVDGATIYRNTLFDVVRNILENPVIDSDIIEAAPFVKEQNYSEIFTATSGDTTTIASPELTQDDDYWNGGAAEVISGTNVGQIRKVTNFVASTNTLTTEAFTAAIDNTSKIKLIRTFKKEIDRAFDRFKIDMKNRGVFYDRIIDNSQIAEYIIILTLHYICDNFSTDPVDKWADKATKYKTDYTKLIGVAVFEYDADNTGNIDSSEEQSNVTQIKAVR